MGEYFVDVFNPFDGYGVEIEAVDPVVTCYFMHQWIAVMSEEEKKPEENSNEPKSPDAILYEPIVPEKKKKEPEPDPMVEDFYCED